MGEHRQYDAEQRRCRSTAVKAGLRLGQTSSAFDAPKRPRECLKVAQIPCFSIGLPRQPRFQGNDI